MMFPHGAPYGFRGLSQITTRFVSALTVGWPRRATTTKKRREVVYCGRFVGVALRGRPTLKH